VIFAKYGGSTSGASDDELLLREVDLLAVVES